MYESPINVFELYDDIVDIINKEKERMVLEEIKHIGIDVDKEELIKALAYDREQYDTGYKVGYDTAIDDFANLLKEYANNSSTDYIRVSERENIISFTIDFLVNELKGGTND